MQEVKPFGTIREAIEHTGLNRVELYRLIAAGEISTAKFGRKRILDFESLRAAVAKRMKAGPVDAGLSAQMAARRRKQDAAA
jgi:excisionase family DNA binding protein